MSSPVIVLPAGVPNELQQPFVEAIQKAYEAGRRAALADIITKGWDEVMHPRPVAFVEQRTKA